LYLAREYYGPEVDIWALGVVLYSMCSGTFPFSGSDIHQHIKSGTYSMPSYFSVELKQIITSMLQVDTTKRATLTQLLSYPWINGEKEGERKAINSPESDSLPAIPSVPEKPVEKPPSIKKHPHVPAITITKEYPDTPAVPPHSEGEDVASQHNNSNHNSSPRKSPREASHNGNQSFLSLVIKKLTGINLNSHDKSEKTEYIEPESPRSPRESALSNHNSTSANSSPRSHSPRTISPRTGLSPRAYETISPRNRSDLIKVWSPNDS